MPQWKNTTFQLSEAGGELHRMEQKAAVLPLKQEGKLLVVHQQVKSYSMNFKCCLTNENAAKSENSALTKYLSPLFKPKLLAFL